MYAVINDRGKQYTVKAGERLRVDRMKLDSGEAVVFERVLLVGAPGGGGDDVRIGQPVVEGASVHATVLGEHKDRKIIVFKKKRRKKYRRKQGHRQRYTDVHVEKIEG